MSLAKLTAQAKELDKQKKELESAKEDARRYRDDGLAQRKRADSAERKLTGISKPTPTSAVSTSIYIPIMLVTTTSVVSSLASTSTLTTTAGPSLLVTSPASTAVSSAVSSIEASTATPTISTSSATAPIMSTMPTDSTTTSVHTTYRIHMPSYKSTADIENFIDCFKQFCITQNVAQISKANMVMSLLDDATFNVVKRELTIVKRTDNDTVRHLLKRFDTYRESGQRRLMFKQAKRDPAQSFEEFYTSLLELASKSFSG